MKKFRVMIVPSSEDENSFEEASNFTEALEISKSAEGGFIYEFDTSAERDAFILGYKNGIGYLGDGVYFYERSSTDEA
jgi:hypothetical protein